LARPAGSEYLCTEQYNTVGVIKTVIAEIMFKTLEISSVGHNVVFLVLLFFLGQKKKFSCGKIYFHRQCTLAAVEGHEVTHFFKSGFFLQDAWQKLNQRQ
jgi:hypothetical protein